MDVNFIFLSKLKGCWIEEGRNKFIPCEIFLTVVDGGLFLTLFDGFVFERKIQPGTVVLHMSLKLMLLAVSKVRRGEFLDFK